MWRYFNDKMGPFWLFVLAVFILWPVFVFREISFVPHKFVEEWIKCSSTGFAVVVAFDYLQSRARLFNFRETIRNHYLAKIEFLLKECRNNNGSGEGKVWNSLQKLLDPGVTILLDNIQLTAVAGEIDPDDVAFCAAYFTSGENVTQDDTKRVCKILEEWQGLYKKVLNLK